MSACVCMMYTCVYERVRICKHCCHCVQQKLCYNKLCKQVTQLVYINTFYDWIHTMTRLITDANGRTYFHNAPNTIAPYHAVSPVTGIATEYWLNDLLHNDDGPARIWHNGTKEWRVFGRLHRTDGPAIEYSNGGCGWYQDGVLHRTDGPAVEWATGYKEWWTNGKRDRIEWPNGRTDKGSCFM